MEVVTGKSILNGVAIGPLRFRFYKKEETKKETSSALTPAQEWERVEAAIAKAQEHLAALYEKALTEVGEDNAAIFEIHQMMLEDEDYLDAIKGVLETQGGTAEYAVAATGENFAAAFAAMDDAYMRLSFIGSVNYEAMAAGFGAQAMGTTLDNLTPLAFSCGVWVMCCGSLGWQVFTLLFTDKMEKVNHLLSRGRQKMVPIISAGAMLGAFANLSSGNFFNSEGGFAFGGAPAIATIFGCVLMMILTKLARTKNIGWLREWAFAISMFSGMLVGTLWNSAM